MGFLRATARYLFCATLIVAPWMYGGTTATSILVINWLLGLAMLLWIVELSINRRRPKLPKLLIFLIVALLAIGCWMTINARSIYDAEFGTFALIKNVAARAPGSFDYAISAAWMIRALLLLTTMLFVVDLSRDDKALLQLWWAIVLAGASISLLGLLQKATGAQAILWQSSSPGYGTTFFATYYYHANAGSFLNLVLPLSAGLAVRVFGIESNQAVRSICLMAFLLNLIAIAANTSRGAQLIAALILLALLWQLGPRIFRGLSQAKKNIALGGAAAVLLMIFALGQTAHLDQPVRRWEMLGEHVSADARWSASRVAMSALSDTGLFGSGPGTFRVVFPAYNQAANNLAGGTWRFLHEDYLQIAMEWGWLGSALWAAIFFGGMANAVLCLRRQTAFRRGERSDVRGQLRSPESASLATASSSAGEQRFSPSRRLERARGSVSEFTQEWSWRRRLILPLAVIALAGVALHAAVDFPLQIASIQLYVATYLGLCWGSTMWKGRSRK
jgi:predicted nucleic acid-binding Zn ribbon protein